LRNFRNIRQATLDTDRQFIVLHGPNGAGKTSILEAVDVLSSLKSFRDHSISNVIQNTSPTAFVDAQVMSPLGTQRMLWGYHKDKGRLLQLDGKKIKDLTQWFQCLRSILFCPEQIDIIRGAPEVRRRFLDRAKFIADPMYLSTVRNYIQVLKQKKELLKKDKLQDAELLPWNLQLQKYGSDIITGRLEILEELREPFQQMHQQLVGNEKVSLSVQGVGSAPASTAPQRFASNMQNMLSEEVRRKQILVGPHRDDLEIMLNGMSARKFASQGQTRSIIVSLKLAELEAAKLRGERPLFLMDDLSSELDLARRKKLIQLLAEREGQVWITTTQPNFLSDLPRGRIARFHVENGEVRPE